jgi:geranylgeranyl pyrophosphate synthase
MSRAAYFKYLEETAILVGPFLEKVLRPYQELNEGLYNELMLFAGSRLRRPLQKPALFRLSYEACGGKEWERFIPVAVAFELLNISSYQANASFDHKLGTLTDEKKDAQFICSMISRELATKVLRECPALSAESLAGLEASISHINEHIYLAQYYDLFVLNIHRLDSYLADERLFMDDYEKRCFFGSGIINGQICYWGGRLASGSDERLAALKTFGEEFGTALQIANDIGDYAPADRNEPNPRDYQDRYSDLRNGRLTAMLYQLLVQLPELTQELIRLRANPSGQSPEVLQQLADACVSSGAFEFTKKLAAKHGKQAASALSSFGTEDRVALLKQLASVVVTNKFNTAFRKDSDACAS